MTSRQPDYPMPATIRDDVETELIQVPDRDLVARVRRLVATSYAHGFHDGRLYAAITGINDRNAREAP